MKTDEKKLKLEKVEKKRKEGIAKVNLEYDAAKATGQACTAMSAKWLIFREPKSKLGVLDILSIYEPSIKVNASLRYAGKPDMETESPFLLCIGNFTHIQNDNGLHATLKYVTEKGLSIWIDLNKDLIEFYESRKQVDVHSRAKNPDMYSFFSLKKSELKCQQYHGGHLTYHGKRDEFINMLK